MDIALGDLSTSLSGVADNEFKRIQIDAATKAGKESFDEEKYMKKEREEFLSREHARIKEKVSGIDAYINSTEKETNFELLATLKGEIECALRLVSGIKTESGKLIVAKTILGSLCSSLTIILENRKKVAQTAKMDV